MIELASLQSLAAQAIGASALGADAPAPGPWWAASIPFLPLLATVLCGLCWIFKVRSKLPAWLTVGCLAASFAATVAMYLNLPSGGTQVATAWHWINLEWPMGEGSRGNAPPVQQFAANLSFYIDSLTCLWMLFVTGLATLIALYASEYMAGDAGPGYCRFYAAFSLFVFSMACLVMADNFVLLYLGWEGVGLCSYLLIGYFYKKPSAVAAAKKAFIVNRIGDLGLALGIMLIFVKFGTVEYAALFANEQFQAYLALAAAGNFAEIPFQVQCIAFLLMVGAFGKSAQFPLYVWLPDAMEGPTPVSALIHAATMVTAGVFLIARTFWVFQMSEHALPTVAWIGTITALLAATIGMAQFDIKRIMAYSTVSQLGYMFAGLGVMTSVGACFHVFTHAFFKALLFLACGAVMHGFAGQLDLRKLSGVRKMPGWGIVGITMLIGCLNLAGVPVITAGFWSKDMILAQAFATPWASAIGWILLFTAGLTAYYTFRVYFRVFEGPEHFEPGDELHAHGGGDDAHGHDHAHDHAHGHAPEAGHADGEGHGDAHGGHGHFHPHAPGPAINLVLVVLAVGTFVAIGLNFVGPHAMHGGWVADLVEHSSAHAAAAHGDHGGHGDGHAHAHGTFLGMDPHKVMYFVSGIVGIVGILIAAYLHGPRGAAALGLGNRERADVSRADALLPRLGPVPRWAQNKWYVDEFYDFLIRIPLWVLSNIFYFIDKLLVDGLVNLFGFLPRWIGGLLRPAQSGRLHGYAAAMAGGVAVLLLIVLLTTSLKG